MQAGTLVGALADIEKALEADGFIAADGSFDESKLSTVAEVMALIASVEAILTKRGVTIPAKITAVIGALPLLVQLEQLLTK